MSAVSANDLLGRARARRVAVLRKLDGPMGEMELTDGRNRPPRLKVSDVARFMARG